jgi:hypothetical protein
LLNSHVDLTSHWRADWLYGLPLLVGTVIFHVCAFVLVVRFIASLFKSHTLGVAFREATIAVAALAAAVLHSIEALAWALLYLALGALHRLEDAMLYSINAITAFGHTSLALETHWQLLGAIEAMNGLILFGLTTAFLFAAIEMARADHQR